ncbi:MAG: hypothetical protein HYU84_08950 [Chloroflexi bacterium]|nr:hypothetical protein [Chloroflexota bacterium]MBI3166963.1 hypothetical protein [Chloroflexota bacterium]
MTRPRTFFKGFLIGLSVFILLNILASALFSNCGLPALFGLGACADAISRAGFPFVFLEQGGFAYHSDFNPPLFFLDLLLGLGFAVMTGLLFSKFREQK